ncbi:hypothetical protein ABTB23_19885, partial [Acinetobacter baumannii]
RERQIERDLMTAASEDVSLRRGLRRTAHVSISAGFARCELMRINSKGGCCGLSLSGHSDRLRPW